MHLGNGAITPECAVVTWGLAVSGVAWSARQLLVMPRPARQWLSAGAIGACLLAAQMVNVPVLPGVSGHLLGGVLAACLLGPELAILVMASVLAIQALCFGDGGLAAWGANLVNMGILPAGLVLATGIRGRVFDGGGRTSAASARRTDASLRWIAVAQAGCLAAASVVLAAVSLVVQVGFGSQAVAWGQLPAFAASMLQSHLIIGLVEGLVTATCLGLLALSQSSEVRRNRQIAWAGVVATGLLVLGLPWASPLPDGYEAAAERSGLEQLMSEQPEVLARLGQLNHGFAAWQQSGQAQWQQLLGDGWASLALAIGLAALLPALAAGLAELCQQRRTEATCRVPKSP